LRHVLRQVRIAVDLPQRCGIDEVDVPLHQFGKGFFRTGVSIAAEQFAIGRHVQLIAPAQMEIAQEKIRIAGFQDDTSASVVLGGEISAAY